MLFYNHSDFTEEIQDLSGTLHTFYLLAVLVDTGDRELDPLRNVCAVVANALKILGNHQQIQRIFALGGFCCNNIDDTFFDPGKIIIHHIM